MFDKATRLKLRFTTSKGEATVEDLWDLPLSSERGHPNLDTIAINLNKQLKDADEVSFVLPSKSKDEITRLKFDVVRHIIEVRLGENAAKAKERENAEKKEKILAILADKQDESLKTKSVEELQALAASL
jgi:hypothetical protein